MTIEQSGVKANLFLALLIIHQRRHPAFGGNFVIEQNLETFFTVYEPQSEQNGN
jgi:hypothetical protein